MIKNLKIKNKKSDTDQIELITQFSWKDCIDYLVYTILKNFSIFLFSDLFYIV